MEHFVEELKVKCSTSLRLCLLQTKSVIWQMCQQWVFFFKTLFLNTVLGSQSEQKVQILPFTIAIHRPSIFHNQPQREQATFAIPVILILCLCKKFTLGVVDHLILDKFIMTPTSRMSVLSSYTELKKIICYKIIPCFSLVFIFSQLSILPSLLFKRFFFFF